MESEKIIIEPILTEKTNIMREGDRKKYVFKVSSDANKIMVMRAVKDLFSVKPESCNILNTKKKPRSARTKSGMRKGYTTPWKKAIVTLAPGDSIEKIEGT